jgi:hypothetical protein
MIKIVARKKRSGAGGWLLFWLAFFIGITLLFMLNLERIKNTLRETRVLERLVPGAEGTAEEEDGAAGEEVSVSSEPPGLAEPEPLPPVEEDGGSQGREPSEAPPVTSAPAATAPTVERSVYLMKVDNTGAILWTKVKRDLRAGDSPLRDALEALIRGPSAEEEKQGLISLIPKNVKILNAAVRGNTAYISFSEDFLFNTYGVEGYVGQRRQVVMTATEFGNVRDVQILIDGKRLDYLGESIWIGSPVSRNML